MPHCPTGCTLSVACLCLSQSLYHNPGFTASPSSFSLLPLPTATGLNLCPFSHLSSLCRFNPEEDAQTPRHDPGHASPRPLSDSLSVLCTPSSPPSLSSSSNLILNHSLDCHTNSLTQSNPGVHHPLLQHSVVHCHHCRHCPTRSLPLCRALVVPRSSLRRRHQGLTCFNSPPSQTLRDPWPGPASTPRLIAESPVANILASSPECDSSGSGFSNLPILSLRRHQTHLHLGLVCTFSVYSIRGHLQSLSLRQCHFSNLATSYSRQEESTHISHLFLVAPALLPPVVCDIEGKHQPHELRTPGHRFRHLA